MTSTISLSLSLLLLMMLTQGGSLEEEDDDDDDEGADVYLVQLRPVGPGRRLVASQSREPHLSLMEMMDGLLSPRASALHQQEQPLLLTLQHTHTHTLTAGWFTRRSCLHTPLTLQALLLLLLRLPSTVIHYLFTITAAASNNNTHTQLYYYDTLLLLLYKDFYYCDVIIRKSH